MEIKIFTNTGDHKPNEDYTDYSVKNGITCAIVADGLGGHGSGEVASKTAVEAALIAFNNKPELSQQCIKKLFYRSLSGAKSKSRSG